MSGSVLEFTWVNLSLGDSWLVRNWGKVNENVVLCWDQVLSSKRTPEHLSHLLWVVSLGSEIEIEEFPFRLHNNIDVSIETVILCNQKSISGGLRVGNSILAMPVSS